MIVYNFDVGGKGVDVVGSVMLYFFEIDVEIVVGFKGVEEVDNCFLIVGVVGEVKLLGYGFVCVGEIGFCIGCDGGYVDVVEYYVVWYVFDEGCEVVGLVGFLVV